MDICNIVAENTTVLLEAEFVNDELEYLAEISKQGVEDLAWFLHVAFVNVREKRKEELVSQKEQDVGNPQPI